MVKVADTLNYINQSTKSLHSSGYNYTVFMDDFFNYDTSTGLVEHGPPTKRKWTATATQSVPAEEAPQTPEEQTATVFQATHQPIKQDKYPLNKINITMTVIMLISICQSTTPLQRQHRLHPKTHVTVGSTSHKPQNWSNTKVLYIKQRDTVALSVGSPTGTIGGLGNISGFSTFKFIPIYVKWLDAN